ncbi:hypothetical protein [Pedobacter punctiformis]|uniref:YcxB-like protein domain-containing protein n=1 Tax=Pedobacter punctiformis TaxID=3004097 RepID=A0ABT4L8L2_9SPHI|nr:hypothetical protein [Pedobacter sp. HCMS5-2]MCZ4244264.1 hypothetical protein [Pedobacter sp. HCMS5-2]
MRNTVFTFRGLDAKTELRLALLLIIPSLIIMLGTLYAINLIFPNGYFLSGLVFSATLTVAISTLILKQLVKKIRNNKWDIKIENEQLDIKFKDITYNLHFEDIKMIKNIGNAGLRYLTIKTKQEVIKIRVGNAAFAPFSTQEDIDELDAFVEFIKPYIDMHFNKKILKNIARPNIIPNFGVYVVKGEKIKYSLINKMTPVQVALFILGIGVLVMILFMNGLIYFIDNK